MTIEEYTTYEADCDGCDAAFDDENGRLTFTIHYHLIIALVEAGWEASLHSAYVKCPDCRGKS